ncbi:hypothetical protein BHU72_09465 [Desulfuribacillus stibiiarsenatis]|uniref:Uncharacterized protein n=1 Tax=Desulfuribacillus stibiiarsenatis TaxID=1390249 RepID=A0A1E5L2X7_9FIRM|nr:RNA methyltransferase [Desulfuribacillus stibiiarsenatis]OEH84436.1 hypothetical protein BHU72_09465 [Desulfuribacillus stibiiarsenatis]
MSEYPVIQSQDNAKIKKLKKLHQKKYREEFGAFIIDGEKLLEEALCNNLQSQKYSVKEIYISESFVFERLNEDMIGDKPVYQVEDKLFSQISTVKSPKGCLAVVEKHESMQGYDWILNSDQAAQLIIILDQVQDPGNVGTIIRIADAVGAKAVILGAGCADPYNEKTIRAAMGSIFHVPVIEEDLHTAIQQLKEVGFHFIGADIVGDSYDTIDTLPEKVALVMGSEGNGISEEIRSLIDSFITIPMPGKAESLNVSVATGIIAFDLIRRWGLAKA